MIRKTLLNSVLVVLPTVFLIIGLNFNRTWFSGDPEYAYLLNGINIANLHSVGHTDNPGTPAQMYSAVVLRIAHFFDFSEKSDLTSAVLRNPDAYVELERKVSIIINSIMMLFLGFLSFLVLRNIWISLILQATPFISSNLLEIAFTKVSPEPVLIFIIMILILVLLQYYKDFKEEKKIYPWVFGAISGFGLATKATFLPLAFLPLFLMNKRRLKLTYLLTLLPAFVLFTLPALPEYPHMAKWFLGLSTHTGTYGQGDSGIIDLASFFSSIPLIIANNLAMSFSILAFFILFSLSFYWGKFQIFKDIPALQFIASIAGVQLMGILMVAKHYHANHYLIPVISLTGIAWVFGILSLKEIPGIRQNSIIRYTAPAVLIILLLFGFSNKKYLEDANNGYLITNQEYTQVKTRLDNEFANYVKAYYYPVSINPYSALRWGSVYSKQLHLENLRTYYPEGLFYDNRINRFQKWEAILPTEDLVNEYGSKILLVGGPMTKEEKVKIETGGLSIKEIYIGRTQAIYEVDTANSPIFKGINQRPVWKVFCGAESTTRDNQWFEGEGLLFRNSNNQSQENVRSGKYAIKLPFRDSYAMEIELDSIHPGQQYRFTAWRKGGEGSAFLVVSSVRNNSLYFQNADYLDTDDKGWKKVNLDITIPSDYNSGNIKFYLWNSSNSSVYFDDLIISRIL